VSPRMCPLQDLKKARYPNRLTINQRIRGAKVISNQAIAEEACCLRLRCGLQVAAKFPEKWGKIDELD
jgi:hypothetical protein